MEPLSPVVVRRKTLTNSAAEFVERRVDMKALCQLENPTEEFDHLQDDSEFFPEIDRFAPQGANLVVEECYKQSKESRETFKATLKNFAAILRERGVGSSLVHRWVRRHLANSPIHLHRKQDENSARAVDKEDREQELDVVEALKQLQGKIENLEDEANMCGQERLGRIERNGVRVEDKIEHMEPNIKAFIDERFSSIETNFREVLVSSMKEALYHLFASNPNFNAKTGEVDYEALKLVQQEKEARSMLLREEDIRQVSRWLKKFEGPAYDPMVDMKDCLERIELLHDDEKDISQWILRSDEHIKWLEEKKSSVIYIKLQAAPDSFNNPISFNSALIAITLQSTANFLVLAFFCKHRRFAPSSKYSSGPTTLVKSLNGQLLRFIINRPSVDLSPLRDRNLLSNSKKSFKDGLVLFEALLSSLPKDDMVFIIIDSVSFLWGSEQDKEIEKLIKVIRKVEDIVIKLMVTDALPNSNIKKVADILLYVPDDVGGNGMINTAENMSEIVKKTKREQNLKDGDGEISLDDGGGDEQDDSDDKEDSDDEEEEGEEEDSDEEEKEEEEDEDKDSDEDNQ
ncbi:hypothetical protein DSL72_003543 [Monilinia vaccinii-corymbosi]|uniref:Uncharacterized protein n=1 Tax=Monilinia vaccinii-corymbosi TaxID=61207 RepID=A0A8A3NUA2_9HELO|nr:hypothetical protein DSL72_003543 [Monilinia vaccinii-corymbosi]